MSIYNFAMQLPGNYFQTMPLSSAQVDEYKDLGAEIIHNGRLQWQLASNSKSYRLYKATNPNGPPGANLHCGTIQVMATIDEVASLFRSETTDEAKAMRRRFNHRLLDAVVLHTILRPTELRPNEKSQREFVQNGRRGLVCAVKSIEVEACPNMEPEWGLVRMQNWGSGHVVVESEDRRGYLDVSYVSNVDMGVGKSEWFLSHVLHRKQWLADLLMRKRCQNIGDIDRFLRLQRLGKTAFEPNFVTLDSRRSCFVCQRRFSFFQPRKKKANCAKCGEVVCSKCCLEWPIRDVQVKVCSVCSAPSYTRDRQETADTVCSDPWRLQGSTILAAESEFDQWLTTMERATERNPPEPVKPKAQPAFSIQV
ncbi:hypothetical protein B5M09_008316 [Aphanomyces astaci]|uniref:FYVE-type domain-containing protein n=1 Tax=Aphanomyces astaci TaxID=112090 RepID=A0A425DNY0_APHAT|nr:hypothetical protein B5M09_008316 [Aphanomyces astaci]